MPPALVRGCTRRPSWSPEAGLPAFHSWWLLVQIKLNLPSWSISRMVLGGSRGTRRLHAYPRGRPGLHGRSWDGLRVWFTSSLPP